MRKLTKKDIIFLSKNVKNFEKLISKWKKFELHSRVLNFSNVWKISRAEAGNFSSNNILKFKKKS